MIYCPTNILELQFTLRINKKRVKKIELNNIPSVLKNKKNPTKITKQESKLFNLQLTSLSENPSSTVFFSSFLSITFIPKSVVQ